MIKVYQLKALQNNYIVSIPFKGVRVRCEFKDGNIAKGIYARLYTNDPFRQMAIEKSEMYGKMWQLVEKVKEPGDDVAPKPAKKAAGTTKPKPAGNGAGTMAGKPAGEPAGAEAKTADKTQDAGTAAESDGEPAGTEAEPKQMEFDNLSEAILYVAQHFGVQVQNANEARKVLSENGIKAVIHNG